MSNLVIATNIAGINTHRSLRVISEKSGKASEKLSSGFKINRAADDAAGLAISEKMRNQVKGLNRASRNAADGISLIQTADGAMAECHEMLKRCRELCVQCANDTNSAGDRAKAQTEIDQLLTEMDQVTDRTEFNTIKVLQGDASGRSPMPQWVDMIGNSGFILDNATPITVDDNRSGSSVPRTVNAYGIVDFSSLTARNVNELVDTGFYHTCCTCSMVYNLAFNDTGDTSVQIDASGNKLINVDITGVTNGADLVARIVQSAATSFDHFTGIAVDPANSSSLVVFDERQNMIPSPAAGYGMFRNGTAFGNQGGFMLKVGANAGGDNNMYLQLPNVGKIVKGLTGNVDVSNHVNANQSLLFLDDAVEKLSEERARMGAYQNRLEHTVKNVDNSEENLASAESRIRDTDMAKEMMEFTKANILSQAGMSMLAQANQSPNQVLTLIR